MRLLVAGLLLGLAGLILYGDSLGGYFLSDDFSILARVHQDWEHNPWDYLRMFYTKVPGADSVLFHRPITKLSLMVDYGLWGGWAPGFRTTNLLLHVLCALLLWRLTAAWTKSLPVAWLAAMFFVVLPLHTEAVMWIVARDEVLALLFVLLALNVTVGSSAPRASRLAGWSFSMLGGLAALCAFWGKESAFILAPLVSTYYLLQHGSFRARIGRALRSSLWVWVLLGCYLVNRYYILGGLGGMYPQAEDPNYLSVEYASHRVDYVAALFAPLKGDDFPLILRLLAGVVSCLLVATAVASRGRETRPWLTDYLAAWVLLALLPYLWVDLDVATFEGARHLYAASAPFCMLLAIGAGALATRLLPASGPLLAGGAAVMVLALGWATWVTKQSHLQATVLSRQIVNTAHVALEGASAETHKVVLEGLPFARKGAHLGCGMNGLCLPPFLHPAKSFTLELWTDRHRIERIVSYLGEAMNPQERVERWVWNRNIGSFERHSRAQDRVILRARLTSKGAQLRVLDHPIQLEPQDAKVTARLLDAASKGAPVELSGRVTDSGRSRRILVTSAHKVLPILEVPATAMIGGEAVLRVHAEPGTEYWLVGPAVPGFFPVYDAGTLMLTSIQPRVHGKVPESGVAEHKIQVPDLRERVGQRFYYQAVLVPQDPKDPRPMTLSACLACELKAPGR